MLFLWCRFLVLFFFFFKQKTAYEMRISDWSSDVCSSDLAYHAEGLDDEVCRHFQLDAPQPELARWDTVTQRIAQPDGEVTIGVVGKYVSLLDAYKSLAESLAHGGIANNAKVNVSWLDSEILECDGPLHRSEEQTYELQSL